jgi:hypothetical protein
MWWPKVVFVRVRKNFSFSEDKYAQGGYMNYADASVQNWIGVSVQKY